LIQSGDRKLVTKLEVVCAEGLSDARDQHAETRQHAPGSQSHPGPLGPQRLGRNGAERLAPAYREQLRYDTTHGGYKTGITEGQLRSAPEFSRQDEKLLSGHEREELGRYYDIPPPI